MIEESIPNSYDIEKSNQLVSSVADKPGDNTFSVALALKKYPCNIAAFVYAIEHKYDCPGLNALLLFLGIKKRVDSIVSDNKNKQLNNLTKDVRAVSNGNDGVNLIKINSDWLDDQDVKTLLSVLSIVISAVMIASLVGCSNSNNNSSEYVAPTKANESSKAKRVTEEPTTQPSFRISKVTVIGAINKLTLALTEWNGADKIGNRMPAAGVWNLTYDVLDLHSSKNARAKSVESVSYI